MTKRQKPPKSYEPTNVPQLVEGESFGRMNELISAHFTGKLIRVYTLYKRPLTAQTIGNLRLSASPPGRGYKEFIKPQIARIRAVSIEPKTRYFQLYLDGLHTYQGYTLRVRMDERIIFINQPQP